MILNKSNWLAGSDANSRYPPGAMTLHCHCGCFLLVQLSSGLLSSCAVWNGSGGQQQQQCSTCGLFQTKH